MSITTIEYKRVIISYQLENSIHEIDRMLVANGNEGWLLVTIISDPFNQTFYFMRKHEMEGLLKRESSSR